MNRYNLTDSLILSLLCTIFVVVTQLDFVILVSRNLTFLSNSCVDNINGGITKNFGCSTKNKIHFNIPPNQNDEDGPILSHRYELDCQNPHIHL